MAEQINLEILASTKEATKAIKDFSETASGSLKKLESNTSFASRAFSSFVGNLTAALAVKSLEVLTGAAKKLFNTFVVEGVAAAQAQEEAINKLNFALKASGEYSRKTSQDLVSFAKQMQNTTKFSDDLILSNLALLSSLTNLDSNGLKKATQAALDLAAATGKDLNEATMMIAKAAEGEVGSFKRLGIEIKKGITDSETFANTLKALAKFQGAAAAETNSYAGRLAQLKNSFGDIQKSIGEIIIKNPMLLKILQLATDLMKKIEPTFASAAKWIVAFMNSLVSELATFFSVLTMIAANIYDQLGKVAEKFFALFLMVIDLKSGWAAFTGAIDKSNESLENFKKKTGFAGQLFLNFKEQVKNNTISINDFNKSILKTIDNIEALKKKSNEQIFAGAPEPSEAEPTQKKKRKDTTIRDLLNQYSEQQNLEKENAKKRLSSQIEYLDKLANVYQGNATKLVEIENEKNRLILELQQYYSALELSFLEQKEAQRNEVLRKDLDAYLKYHLEKNDIDTQNNTARLLAEQEYLNNLVNQNKLAADELKIVNQKIRKNDEALFKERVNQASTFFGDMSSLMRTGNRQLFEIGKAAALAQAIIQGYVAVQNALAIPPWWVGAALAVAAAAKAAVQIAGIQSTNLATGLTKVPAGFPNDTFRANLTSGERVVSVEQNKDLTAFLESQRKANDDDKQNLFKDIRNILAEMLIDNKNKEQTIVVNIGDREIIREIRYSLRAGYSLEVT